jgi:hypothetical protein
MAGATAVTLSAGAAQGMIEMVRVLPDVGRD